VPEVHKYVGFFVVGLFTVGWAWGLGAWALKRGPGARFWTWLTAAQVVAIVQALIGITLLVIGYRPLTWLHLVYGFGPLVVLAIAHATARQEQYQARPWVPFAWAAFINFGLTLRAVMTGLGG
jgi:cytochrome b561